MTIFEIWVRFRTWPSWTLNVFEFSSKLGSHSKIPYLKFLASGSKGPCLWVLLQGHQTVYATIIHHFLTWHLTEHLASSLLGIYILHVTMNRSRSIWIKQDINLSLKQFFEVQARTHFWHQRTYQVDAPVLYYTVSEKRRQSFNNSLTYQTRSDNEKCITAGIVCVP